MAILNCAPLFETKMLWPSLQRACVIAQLRSSHLASFELPLSAVLMRACCQLQIFEITAAAAVAALISAIISQLKLDAKLKQLLQVSSGN